MNADDLAALRARVAELESERATTRATTHAVVLDVKEQLALLYNSVEAERKEFGSVEGALRARVAELEAQAKGHADECAVGIKLRDSVAAELGVLLDERKALILECLSLRQHHQLAAVLPTLVGLLHDEAITASPRNLATAIDRITAILEGK